MDETCQKTVPEAIIAFLESEDFEDAVRNAVSLGGDTDTLGAITGSIAEAFYGMLLFMEVMVTRMNWHLRKSMASCLLKRCKWWYNRSVVAFINWKIYGSFMTIREYKNESY